MPLRTFRLHHHRRTTLLYERTLWDVRAVRLREQRIWMRYKLARSTPRCCHRAGRLHQSWCVSAGSLRARSFSARTLIRSTSCIQSATVHLCASARCAWSLRTTVYPRAFAALAAADISEYVVCSDWRNDRLLLLHRSCARIPSALALLPPPLYLCASQTAQLQPHYPLFHPPLSMITVRSYDLKRIVGFRTAR